MNDRLMIAAMAAQSDLSRSDAKDRLFASIAADAFRMADALLAAAGEQETTKYSPVSIVDQPVSRAEYDRQVARSEAAEAKCADLERENAALRRQAEPLTRDELVESGDARKFWHGLTVTETIALVAAADRIRSRRFSNG